MPEELLDVLDENGNQTGVALPRSEVHKKGLWHRVVHLWIVNKKGELIIQKRSPQKESWPNKWDISAAGHCSAGDSSVVSAMREVEEELGYKLELKEIEDAFLFSVKIESIQNGGAYINKEWVDLYLLEKEIDLSTLVLQESELTEVKWIHYRDLVTKLNENDQDFVPCETQSEYRKLFTILQERYP
eukprot:TRINITY_DN12131_c0_g1_i1.p1 TRINITY_DN12131_c0_g1~~TRINITY_DN12131_c0_g1_i1.p1  ORF type:complete len:187 (-),score=50.02 TRINITY_DN12131_c0_g1_i1:4-564(-)